jgi:hypothetical protein
MARGAVKRGILVIGIVLAWSGLTYNPQVGWWISWLAAAVVLLLGWLAFDGEWRARFGIATGARGLLVFLATLAIALPGSYLLLGVVGRASGISFEVADAIARPGALAFTTCQTLNEELVVGALLLLALDRRYPDRRTTIAIGVAAVFGLMHVLLYGSPHQEMFGNTPVLLDPLTVASLVFVGILRNAAILIRGDIAVAWGIHLGFNVPFFVGGRVVMREADLTEPGLFDAVFAHPAMVAVTAIGAATALLFLRLTRRSASK